MNYKYLALIPFVLLLHIPSSSAIDPVHEYAVGDTFDMILVDLKINGPESSGADLPGTDLWVTPDASLSFVSSLYHL